MSHPNLGRIKSTLNRKCPDCSTNLQIRVTGVKTLDNGISITSEKEFIFCPSCEYSEEHDNKRTRKVRLSDSEGINERNKKYTSIKRGTGDSDRRGVRSRN